MVKNGETRQFEVSAGTHELRMTIDRCGSKSINFSVAEDEVARFDAKSGLRGPGKVLALWGVIFAWSSYIVLVPAKDSTVV